MRILAIPNAHALAHVSRLLEIAKILRKKGHEILFAGHGKYLQIAELDGFATRELPYITVEQVVRAVRTQKLWELYRTEELEYFIEAELALYAEFQPELVLLDNRPTARTSAEKAGLRTAAVLNVHMSNYRRIPFLSYVQMAGRFPIPGLTLADHIENAIERQVYDRVVMGDLNNIRKRMGLGQLYSYQHEEGNLSFLADVPEFNPAEHLPAHMRFIGPITWRNTLPPPTCLDRLDPERPTVYLTLGSEGLDELVVHLDILTRRGIQIVVATGATDVVGRQDVPDGVFLEQYINTDALLPHCDLVCCHGGNGTLYQALSYGLPCVVVATHAEQHYGGKRIQQLGLGQAMTLKQLRRQGMGKLVQAVADVLRTPTYQQAASEYIPLLKSWNGAALAADTIENWL
ncbi:MAG: glycosyltransferase [Gallionellaceae bacterium]|nr:glycosyltransferase [Gallionellaceae bacterium]